MAPNPEIDRAVPIVNGVQLTDLDALEDALSYLREGYNDGGLIRDPDHVTIFSRRRGFEHFSSILAAHSHPASSLQLVDVRATTGDGNRVLVEVTER